MNDIITAIMKLRINPVIEEYELQIKIADVLEREGLSFKKEYKLAPRNRVDFFIDGIVIEVKKGKPYGRQVIEQVRRYSEYEEVKGVILVVEKNLDLPREVNGKPCMSLGLNKLWGIAL